MQVKSDGKLNTLYIVAGIDPDTAVFAPLTKGEIGAFGWHYIRDLPATTEEANQAYLSSAGTKHRFFMVIAHGKGCADCNLEIVQTNGQIFLKS